MTCNDNKMLPYAAYKHVDLLVAAGRVREAALQLYGALREAAVFAQVYKLQARPTRCRDDARPVSRV